MLELKRKLEATNAPEAIERTERVRPEDHDALSEAIKDSSDDAQHTAPATPSLFSLSTTATTSNAVNEREESPEHEPGTHFGTFTEFAKDKSKTQNQRGSKKRKQNHDIQSQGARFGQSAALDIDVGSETSDQEALEAALYLQSVRTEAGDLPYLTRLQSETDIYENGLGDTRGYYSGGAFVSAPVAGPTLPPGYATAASDRSSDSGAVPGLRKPPMILPQKAHKAVVIARYNRLHTLLGSPQSDTMARQFYKEEYLYTFPQKSQTAGRARTMRNWLDRFITRHPAPAQIACGSVENVLELLGMIRYIFRPGINLHANTSAWIWALLCRLDVSDVRGSDEMHIIRELAFRALWVRCGFTGEKIPEVEMKAREFALDNKETFEWLGMPLNKPPTKATRRKTLEADKGNEQQTPKDDGNGGKHDAQPSLEDYQSKSYEIDDELKKLLSARVEELRHKESGQEHSPTDAVDELQPAPFHANATSGVETKKPSNVSDEDEDERPTVNTRTTLDMILVVVSELFGQKDLTKYCEKWDWDLYHLNELAEDGEGDEGEIEEEDAEMDE